MLKQLSVPKLSSIRSCFPVPTCKTWRYQELCACCSDPGLMGRSRNLKVRAACRLKTAERPGSTAAGTCDPDERKRLMLELEFTHYLGEAFYLAVGVGDDDLTVLGNLGNFTGRVG